MRKLVVFLLPKYLRFDKTQPFISITAILAFLGVGIGVMVLCVAMAIMNGMTKEFERKLFVMNYPLSVYSITYQGVDEEILQSLKAQFPQFVFSPYLRYNALSRAGNDMNAAVMLGVDIDSELQLNEVVRKVFVREDGTLDSARLQDFKSQEFAVLVGKEVQTRYFVDVGDKLGFYFTRVEPSALGLAPVSKRFEIAGVFDSGLRAYNEAYTYTHLGALQKIRKLDSGLYDGIHIFSKNPFQDIVALKSFLQETFPNRVGVEGWWEQNGNFFSAMELEKRALFIVLLLIILMASLNIISSLLMVVMTRRKEIALMLSLGVSKKEIEQTFFWLGMFVGGSGIVFGVVLNFIALFVLDTFPIISLPADVYGTSKLPLELSVVDFVLTIVGASVIVCLSSYYPARKASRVQALSVLRNE
ncbi:ABC transporter permease [uncultured Helicobacter sp.]|uniref:ABC transporter permease n=1 Tax=uncultured Helicobacter sp. TaxID=175537 RepID=UPI001C3B1DBC|nr:ABC transporter permease [Candidatus Helicobacter avicola]